MGTKNLTKGELKSAYDELDEIAGIQPPIIWTSQDQFERELYETIVALVEPGDKFSKETQSVFDTLKEMYEDDVPDISEEVEPEVEETTEEPEPEPEPEPVKAPLKGKAKAQKKTTPKPPVEAKVVKNEVPQEKEVKSEPVAPVKEEDDDKSEGLTRADNFATIYGEGMPYTKKEWIKKMQDLYPKKVKNDVGARLHFNVYSKLLIALGELKVTEDGKYVKA
jgi:outer membrane biosynthesis protein TonB